MIYLVTGGCGFIGSHLVDALQQAGNDVRVLDNLSTGRRDNVAAGTEIVEGDVCDEHLVRRCVEDVDGCFHLAAVASVEQGNREWVGTHRINVTGAVCVFDAARRAQPRKNVRVVYASSAAVLGDVSHIPASEDEPANPMSAYGADKYGCELHARVATWIHRVPTLGLRLFNVYGPRQDPSSPYSGVISIFAQRVKKGMPLRIYGDGSQTRDFVYVGDVVRFFVAAMQPEAPSGRIYNVCTGRPTQIKALAAKMAEIAGVSPEVEFAAARSGDIAESLGDPERAARDLGVTANTPFEAGIRKTMEALTVP